MTGVASCRSFAIMTERRTLPANDLRPGLRMVRVFRQHRIEQLEGGATRFGDAGLPTREGGAIDAEPIGEVQLAEAKAGAKLGDC